MRSGWSIGGFGLRASAAFYKKSLYLRSIKCSIVEPAISWARSVGRRRSTKLWLEGFELRLASVLYRRAVGLSAVVAAAGLLAACAAPSTAPSPQAQSAPLDHATQAALHVPGVKDLTGLRQPEILAMLGKPDLKRDEPPAQLWQYRAADCVLNLFFYREPDGYRLVRAEA